MICSIGAAAGFPQLVEELERNLGELPSEYGLRIGLSNRDKVPYVDCSWESVYASPRVFDALCTSIIRYLIRVHPDGTRFNRIEAESHPPLRAEMIQMIRLSEQIDLDGWIRFRLKEWDRKFLDITGKTGL